MKMFLISLVIASVLCLPQMLGYMASEERLSRWLLIPADGLTYMMLLFHEIGHMIGWWLFGYPSVPTFNFTYGGGTTYSFSQSWLVLGIVWIAAGGLGIWLWQHRAYRELGFLGGVVLLHGILLLSGGDKILPIATGHIAEVGVGAFCLLRAFLGTTNRARGAVERWLNMVFGCFTMVHNIALTGLLMFHDIGRMVYAAQKGGHLQGDIDRVALGLGVPMPVIAFSLMLLTIVVFAFTVFYGLRHAPHDLDKRPL